MGDHRATIVISFKMYGFEEKVDMWINWSPQEFDYAVDPRIMEWFQEAATKMRDKHDLEEDERRARLEMERAKADWTDGTWIPPSEQISPTII